MVDFLGGDVEGGDEADGFWTGGWDEEAIVEEDSAEVDGGELAFRDVEFGGVEADAEEEAVAADLGDGGVVPACDGVADLGFARFNIGGEVLGNDGFDDGDGGGTGEGIATIGGAVAAGA